MGVLVVKVVLAPAFVVGASVAMRRFGPRVGGLLGGLPLVAGPILLAFALSHGRSFGADSAASALLGLVSLTCFVVTYGLLAPRLGWRLTLPAGWIAFLASTAVLSAVEAPAGVGFVLALGAFAAGRAILVEIGGEGGYASPPPGWDLWMRAVSALAMVVTLTAVAGALGPGLSGLLAPFPIITSVLAAFTHAQRAPEVRRLLRGFLEGFVAFASFAFVVAVAIRSVGTGWAFLLALVVAVSVQAVVYLRARA